MEQIKIDNFVKENSGISFPGFRTLDRNSCADIALSLSEKLKLDSSANGLALVKEVDKFGEIYDRISAVDEDFDLKEVLSILDINWSGDIYINWYRYDAIDRMRFIDFINNFDNIWYPGSDDIDIFDESFRWIISISHHGEIKFLKFDS